MSLNKIIRKVLIIDLKITDDGGDWFKMLVFLIKEEIIFPDFKRRRAMIEKVTGLKWCRIKEAIDKESK